MGEYDVIKVPERFNELSCGEPLFSLFRVTFGVTVDALCSSTLTGGDAATTTSASAFRGMLIDDNLKRYSESFRKGHVRSLLVP